MILHMEKESTKTLSELINELSSCKMGFPGSSAEKNPPAMQETPVRFLTQEVPLEKG